MTLKGRIMSGVVVLENGSALPEGTLVEVTPVHGAAGSPSATLRGAANASQEGR